MNSTSLILENRHEVLFAYRVDTYDHRTPKTEGHLFQSLEGKRDQKMLSLHFSVLDNLSRNHDHP